MIARETATIKGPFTTASGLGSRKVVLEPIWPRYEGFSYLFDNPGRSLTEGDGIQKLCADEGIKLYNALEDCVTQCGGEDLIARYHLFILPRDTYHVTVWDGINAENIENIREPYKTQCATLFEGLPKSVRRATECFAEECVR